MNCDNAPPAPLSRLQSLDQLRGYTIAGMILVNYLGRFDAMPWMLKHHREGMSYADTIAPLFMFIVGMGFRLSFARRVAKAGIVRARWDALKRYLGITLVGIAFAGPDYRVAWWDALADIGLAGVICIPFIERSAMVRLVMAFAYVALYQAIHLFTDYGAWEMKSTINGGPLGPVSYAFVLLMGTLAYDLLATNDRKKITTGAFVGFLSLCALGWLLKLEWPGLKAAWPFSQYYMTAPYPIYSTGLAFLAFLFFYWLCEVGKINIPTFSILGENALLMYLLHNVVGDAFQAYPPNNAPALHALIGYVCLYAFCYATARKLHNDKIIIKM